MSYESDRRTRRAVRPRTARREGDPPAPAGPVAASSALSSPSRSWWRSTLAAGASGRRLSLSSLRRDARRIPVVWLAVAVGLYVQAKRDLAAPRQRLCHPDRSAWHPGGRPVRIVARDRRRRVRQGRHRAGPRAPADHHRRSRPTCRSTRSPCFRPPWTAPFAPSLPAGTGSTCRRWKAETPNSAVTHRLDASFDRLGIRGRTTENARESSR